MITSYKTDSDEDVIFVSEKRAAKVNEITFDQAKLLALQRDIDEKSQPKQLVKTSKTPKLRAVERPEEMAKIKMEETKSEEGFVKKRKKLKKEEASLPKDENCAVGNGSIAEVKKEKKKGKKKVETAVIDLEEESVNGGSENDKKKKKRKMVTESLNDANGSVIKSENDEEAVKKKKKKRHLADGENQVDSSVKEEKVEKKHKKVQKLKNKSGQIKSENVKVAKEEEEEQPGMDKAPKKVKKDKNKTSVVSIEMTEEQLKEKKKKKKAAHEEAAEAMDEISVTKKKNKAKTKVAETQVKSETPDGEACEVKVKKKKKKDGNEVGLPQIKDGKLRKHEDKSTKSEIALIDEEGVELKKKGKKEKSRKASVEVSEVGETEPKKKKRKKGNSKGEEEEPHSVRCEEGEKQKRSDTAVTAGETTSKKKKKLFIKMEAQSEDESLEAAVKKKKKKKIKEEVEEQNDSSQVDVVFLSAKTGNKDEININQDIIKFDLKKSPYARDKAENQYCITSLRLKERRQALQMEIDEASQPQKPAKPTGLGQWSTAQFDSSDQQQKFLRLMGGFKKGFQPAAGSAGRANMALGKDAQQQLQQGLLGEFERAQSRRLDFSNKGAGLGFSAPSNKKFSIDVNTCRSVRFDD